MLVLYENSNDSTLNRVYSCNGYRDANRIVSIQFEYIYGIQIPSNLKLYRWKQLIKFGCNCWSIKKFTETGRKNTIIDINNHNIYKNRTLLVEYRDHVYDEYICKDCDIIIKQYALSPVFVVNNKYKSCKINNCKY